MIKGMTGFGSAQFAKGDIKATIEIRSLNHRYFDINFYLPNGFGAAEDKLRQVIQKQILRGRVTITVKIVQKPHHQIILNKDVVRQYVSFSNKLKKEFKLSNDLTAADIVNLPGVFEQRETIIKPEAVWPGLEKSIKKALAALLTMRKREGSSLAADVNDKLRRMCLQIKKIQARSKVILRAKKKIYTDEEYQSFQKSCDINEEISRLSHYIDEIKGLVKSNVSVGKKIDFIAQEMQRETNTIGSKLQDKVISNAVIALKSKVEKIREQAQNIE